MNANKINKVKIVADIVKQHYEPGRQDRCLKWCYENVVNKLYPMSVRTFWRYMDIAVSELGYEFKEKEDKFYLDDIFSRMKPETLEKVQDLANDVLKMQPKGKKQIEVYNELRERTGLELCRSNFSMYMNIAETYLGYNFNFQ